MPPMGLPSAIHRCEILLEADFGMLDRRDTDAALYGAVPQYLGSRALDRGETSC